MAIIAQMAASGALMGLVYALIAYGFQLTFATSKSINFGQGELVMVSAFFTLTLITLGLPYWLVVPGGLLFGAALGLFVERAAVRLALEQKSEGWILLTIILGLFLFSVAENVWGRDDRPFPTPISHEPIHVLGVDVTPVELSVAIGVFAIMGAIEVFKRRTLLGKAFDAVYGGAVEDLVFTALTDTRFYGLNYNIPSLCFGATGAAMHGFNEYVDLESLRKSTKATALFIAEWCGVEKL